MRFRAIHFQGCQDKGSEKTFTTFDRLISFQMLNQILLFKMNTPTVITVALKSPTFTRFVESWTYQGDGTYLLTFILRHCEEFVKAVVSSIKIHHSLYLAL